MNGLMADSLGLAIACFGTGCIAVGFLFGALFHPGRTDDDYQPSAVQVPHAPGVWDCRARRLRPTPWWLRPQVNAASPEPVKQLADSVNAPLHSMEGASAL